MPIKTPIRPSDPTTPLGRGPFRAGTPVHPFSAAPFSRGTGWKVGRGAAPNKKAGHSARPFLQSVEGSRPSSPSPSPAQQPPHFLPYSSESSSHPKRHNSASP